MISSWDMKRWPVLTRFLPNIWNRSRKAQELSLPKYFFKTKRLVFRPFDPDDLYPMLTISSKPEVVAYVDDGQPMTEDLVRRWICFSRKTISELGSGTGAVVDRRTNRVIGWAGLSRPENEPPEIVYGFDDSVWRQGYGQEIAAGLVKWCKKDLRLDEVRATVYPDNVGSIRILENLGFKYVDDLYGDEGDVCRLYILQK